MGSVWLFVLKLLGSSIEQLVFFPTANIGGCTWSEFSHGGSVFAISSEIAVHVLLLIVRMLTPLYCCCMHMI
jgi:hypothetical protein